MTQEEAIAKYQTKWWIGKTAKEIIDVQLYEERLICPFDVFHKAIEEVLHRSVYTHEFGTTGVKFLREEYEGKREYDGLLPSIERVMPGKPIILLNPETGKTTNITPEKKEEKGGKREWNSKS